MNENLQNTQSAEPIFVYTLSETENSGVEQVLFRLFEQITNENLKASS